MNWSRIKSIFIVAFLILNSFLGYQLWEKHNNKIELAQNDENSLDELLMLKTIKLKAAINNEQIKMSQINAQFPTYSTGELSQMDNQEVSLKKQRLISKFVSPIEIRTPLNPAQFYNQELKGLVINGGQYAFDRETESHLIYLQMIEKYPIFVSGVDFEKENQEITGYQQTFFHVVNQGTEQPVISSFTAIRTLLDNQMIPQDSTIQQVKLGYYGQFYEVESQILIPVWRVLITNEEGQFVYYVNAYTGAVESAPLF